MSEKCGVALTHWRSMNDCCVSMFNSLGAAFPATRLGQCCFHVLKQVKKGNAKRLVVKENIHRTLADLKQTQKFAFTGVTDSLHGLFKKKYSNETDSTSRVGTTRTTIGLAQNLTLAFLVQTIHWNVSMVTLKTLLQKISSYE